MLYIFIELVFVAEAVVSMLVIIVTIISSMALLLNKKHKPAASFGCYSFHQGGAVHMLKSGVRMEQVEEPSNWY